MIIILGCWDRVMEFYICCKEEFFFYNKALLNFIHVIVFGEHVFSGTWESNELNDLNHTLHSLVSVPQW